MKQVVITEHTLEIRRHPSGMWEPARECHQAVELAWHGHLTEAIQAAQEHHVADHSHMHGVTFRCVTTTKTFTFFGGEINGMVEA